MARYLGPKAKLSRREGTDLYLKSARRAISDKAKKQLRVQDALKLAESVGLPAWVQVDASKFTGVFKQLPDRDQFGADIKEALIVELYSR